MPPKAWQGRLHSFFHNPQHASGHEGKTRTCLYSCQGLNYATFLHALRSDLNIPHMFLTCDRGGTPLPVIELPQPSHLGLEVGSENYPPDLSGILTRRARWWW